MPLSKEHKQESREKILKSAVALFCHNGYDNVSIDDLMQDAKLTRGAFYAHFDSKSDVYMQAIVAAAQNAYIFRNLPEEQEKEKLISVFIENYLSLRHVQHKFSPCPLAFLVTDVANNEPKVKKTYTTVFKGFVALLSKNLPDDYDEQKRKEISLAASALVIGSIAIARALHDELLQNQLLESSKKIAMLLTNSEGRENS